MILILSSDKGVFVVTFFCFFDPALIIFVCYILMLLLRVFYVLFSTAPSLLGH